MSEECFKNKRCGNCKESKPIGYQMDSRFNDFHMLDDYRYCLDKNKIVEADSIKACFTSETCERDD